MRYLCACSRQNSSGLSKLCWCSSCCCRERKEGAQGGSQPQSFDDETPHKHHPTYPVLRHSVDGCDGLEGGVLLQLHAGARGEHLRHGLLGKAGGRGAAGQRSKSDGAVWEWGELVRDVLGDGVKGKKKRQGMESVVSLALHHAHTHTHIYIRRAKSQERRSSQRPAMTPLPAHDAARAKSKACGVGRLRRYCLFVCSGGQHSRGSPLSYNTGVS